jgi:hypothetical protein
MTVPDEGELQLGTVRLPAGRLLRSKGGDGEPVAWMTRTLVAEPGPVWSALSALHGQTGLVPILVPEGWNDFQGSCQETTAVANVDLVDAAAMLEHRWAGTFPGPEQTGLGWDEEREMIGELAAPFTSQYPGLAPAAEAALAPDVLAAALRPFRASRVALVPAGRPADVLPVLGWCPGDWDGAFPAPNPVGFAAVLRSWEERFGARLFGMTHDAAHLLVERPPCDLDAALAVAAEHWVFCDEDAGRQPVRKTAADIVGAPVWYFWWD